MLEIKVTIDAPALAEAINNLAGAVRAGVAVQEQPAMPAQNAVQPVQAPQDITPAPTAPAPVQPTQDAQAGVSAAPQSQPQQTAPVAQSQSVAPAPQPQPQTAPVVQPQPQPQAPVQQATQAAAITLDDLSRAGAALIDQGKMQQVMATIQKYGVLTITQIPQSQYSALAADLRALGAAL